MAWILSASVTVAIFAAMAAIVGAFNQWPAHETIGAFVVCLVAAGLSAMIGRKVLS